MSKNDKTDTTETTSGTDESRRALLKGAVRAMPAVLTLQSGAALARSSNLISASPRDHKDRWGRTLCLDLRTVRPAGRSGRVYDLGHPAYGHVNAVRDREYFVAPDHRSAAVSEARMCHEGGTYYYRARRYRHWSNQEQEGDSLQESTGSNQQFTGSVSQSSSYWGGHRERYWKRVHIRRGVLVSATALSSFSGNITVTDL